MSTALYPVSIDPITNGHLAIVNEARKGGFDKIVILVATNPDKINRYMFTADERAVIAQEAVAHLGDAVQVDILRDGFAADYAKKHNITTIIRGIRSVKDFEAEAAYADGIRQINPKLTVFNIFSPKETELISSSFLKDNIYGPRGWVALARKFAPDATIKALSIKYLRKQWTKLTNKTEADKTIDDLIVTYTAPDRHHHGVEHIIRGLDEIAEFSERVIDNSDHTSSTLDPIRLTWFCHDCSCSGPSDMTHLKRKLKQLKYN